MAFIKQLWWARVLLSQLPLSLSFWFLKYFCETQGFLGAQFENWSTSIFQYTRAPAQFQENGPEGQKKEVYSQLIKKKFFSSWSSPA